MTLILLWRFYMSIELFEKINNVLKNEVVDRHSFFQLKYFVIGNEPTTQSKLWRCVRELHARKDSMDAMKLELEESHDRLALLDIDIKRLEKQLEGENDNFNIEEINIKKRQVIRKRQSLEEALNTLKKKLKYAEEEASFFVLAFESLSSVEKIRPFDDQQSQEEYWNEKLGQEINLKILLRQPLDSGLIKTAISLGDKSPVKKELVAMLEREQKKMLEASKPEPVTKE
jgi:hypothetical protein